MKRRKILVAFLVIDLLLIAVYLGGSWYFSGILLAFPRNTLVEDEARTDLPEPAELGLPAPENVTFAAADETLAGWYFENDLNGDCGMLLLHGRSSTRYGALRFAPLFWDRGCDLLLFDARYHGDSTGEFGTYGYHESDDMLAALDWFTGRAGLSPSQVGLMGTSYARARHVTIVVAWELRKVTLTISDDGRGFNVKSRVHATGHGLSNMRARAEERGGSFTIHSTPGQGTTICLELPLL